MPNFEPFTITRYVVDEFGYVAEALRKGEQCQLYLFTKPGVNPGRLRLDVTVSAAEDPLPVQAGAIVRRKRAKRIPGYVVRWPKDRADWTPINDGSDEWVVCWFYDDGPQEELTCADDFDVVCYLPEGE